MRGHRYALRWREDGEWLVRVRRNNVGGCAFEWGQKDDRIVFDNANTARALRLEHGARRAIAIVKVR